MALSIDLVAEVFDWFIFAIIFFNSRQEIENSSQGYCGFKKQNHTGFYFIFVRGDLVVQCLTGLGAYCG